MKIKKNLFVIKKKISYEELDNDLNINEEEKNNENKEKIKIKKDEYDSKEEISKDEKNNSFEYTITTAYSNSISAHEESNNNTLNLNENLNSSEFKLTSKEINPIESNNYIGYNSEQNKFYGKSKSKEENKKEKINLNKIQENDINNTFLSNSMKNLNFLRINSCPNPINDFSSISSSTQIAKVQNINKFQENISSEPFNKYNLINQELNQLWINPIAENTEILNVNVKISKNKSAIFKLRRFDDLFLTVKLFCEIHLIDEKFMKPIIIKSLCALNNIYQVLNSPIDANNIKRLKMMNRFFNNTYTLQKDLIENFLKMFLIIKF